MSPEMLRGEQYFSEIARVKQELINQYTTNQRLNHAGPIKKKNGGGGAAIVVVMLLWLCCCGCGGGGGADVMVLWWWCVVLWWLLLFGSGVVVVNMENYEDEPVTLTCRSKLKLIKLIRTKFRNTHREELFRNTCFGWLLDLDDFQENCVLIHFMSCPQVERSPEDIVAVPITYHVNGHYIGFGREEFCLITGLRFGLKFSERYEVGLIPFRRLLFESDTDRGHVTGQMLVDNIYGEEFDNLRDEGLLVRAQLYDQLENANEVCAEKLYAAQKRHIPRPAKYTLSGFTWAFKTWILETYNVGALGYYTYQQRYPRAVAWSKITTFQRKNLPNFFEGARPNRRLRPDAFEAKTEWWARRREFFDGRIHEAPPIPTPVKYQVDMMFQNTLIDVIMNWKFGNTMGYPTLILTFFKTQRGCDRTGLKPSRSRLAVRSLTWPKGPQLIRRRLRIPSRHPTSYLGTPHIATPMAQQVFAMWSSANQASPSQNHDVGVAHLDEMRRGIDLNSPVEDLLYMGSRDTDVYISLHNVDPNKVVRNKYVDCMSFLESPKPVVLDCGIKGFVVEEQFWPPGARYTVAKTWTSAMLDKLNKFAIETDFHLMGMLDGSSRPYPSWDDVDIVSI
nr:hypothetical protein [Tanacetum cinerariifolium]